MDYDSLNKQIKVADLEYSLPEIQGIVSGMSCANVDDPLSYIQELLFQGIDDADVLLAECRKDLLRVMEGVISSLEDTEARLPILLPDDEQPPEERARAIGDWSQGFLYGFGLGGEKPLQLLSGEAGEVLHDFAEITRMDLDLREEDEIEESLTELEEYLWVAAMLVYQDVRDLR